MKNVEKITEMKNIWLNKTGTFKKTFSLESASGMLTMLEIVKDNLKKAKKAATWLRQNGIELMTGNNETHASSYGEKVIIAVHFYDSDFIKLLRVTVSDETEVEEEQKRKWVSMSESEQILFVIGKRIKITEREIEKAEQHLVWLQAECEE